MQSESGAANREEVNPGTKKYLLLLYSSATNLLSFAGYTTKKVYDTVKGQQRSLF
jgi:hypothetical protein